MGYCDSSRTVLQNLKDAGCGPELVEQFMVYQEKGNRAEQLKLLSLHRKKLLEQIHQQERQICCLDYLVYQINQEV